MKGSDRRTAGCFVAHRRYLASQCHKGKALGGILEPVTFALCRAAVLFSSFNLCAKSNLSSFNREIPPQNNNWNLNFSVTGWHKSYILSIIVCRHVTVPALIQVNISDLSVASVAAVWGQRGGVNTNCVPSHSVHLLLQFKSVVQRRANLSLVPSVGCSPTWLCVVYLARRFHAS